MTTALENHPPPEDSAFVAVYGGAFDPPHLGHVVIPALIYGRTQAQHVVIVPSYSHPFAKEMAPFGDRVAMCNAAFEDYEDAVTISAAEQEIARGESPVYTVDMLNFIAEQNPEWNIRVVMGADAYGSRHQWRNFEIIEEKYRPLVIPRVGHATPATPHDFPTPPDVSSSRFRQQPSESNYRQMIPNPVLKIINSRALYKREPNN